MSEKENDETVSTEQTGGPPAASQGAADPGGGATATEAPPEPAEPMSAGSPAAAGAAAGTPRPDLDAEAVRAAQAAIAEGERALAAARAQLGTKQQPAGDRSRAKRRELALRLLLAANVLAMLVVMSFPSFRSMTSAPTEPTGSTPTGGAAPETAPGSAVQPGAAGPAEASPPAPAGPRLADKYNQALLASESRNYAEAVALLEEYLAETPRMPASRLVNVYRAMAHYSSAIGRFREAQDYERRAQAVTQSHSLPDDLVAMAKAAAASGDQESLRQVWARFLLQQRQIPSSLYQHVAEAYLELGDSYRIQANEAAEQARLEELRRTDELLQEQGAKRGRQR